MMPDAWLHAAQTPRGPLAGPWRWCLSGAARVWEAEARRRGARDAAAAWWPPVPTFSVGALTAGGAGKTPIAAWIATWLIERGQRPAILLRGAGRGPHRVAPGDRPQDWGDEAVLLARAVPQARVVVDGDRVRGAQAAVTDGATALVLDDGFSHRRLGRDLDILVAPADHPPWADSVLPLGRLREPLEAARRADVLWVHGGAGRWPDAPTHLTQVQTQLAPTAVQVEGALLPVDHLRGRRVGLVSSLARPQRVARALEGLGASVVAIYDAGDHAPLAPRWLARAEADARRRGADALVLTPKDAVKLDAPAPGGALPRWILRADLRFEHGQAALEAILAARLSPRAVEPGP